MFGGLFPSQWSQPLPRHWKPVKNLAAHHFPPKTLRISKPGPEAVPAPVNIKEPKEVYANNNLRKAQNSMPPCECCLNEPPIDTTEIDKLLEDIYNPTPESKAQQILQMIDDINQNLTRNINALQNSPTLDGDNVSKEDLLKLLKGILNYSKYLENYFKETKPSLL